jgi:hypothetical protein
MSQNSTLALKVQSEPTLVGITGHSTHPNRAAITILLLLFLQTAVYNEMVSVAGCFKTGVSSENKYYYKVTWMIEVETGNISSILN